MKLQDLKEMEEDIPTFGHATKTGAGISFSDVVNKGYVKKDGVEEMGSEIREVYKVLKPFYLMKMGPKKVKKEVGDVVKGGWWDPT